MKKKKICISIIFSICIMYLFHNCILEEVIDDKIKSIEVSYNESKLLYINDTIHLKAIAENQYNEFFTIENNKWYGFDSTIVSVKNNIVTALSRGSIRIKTQFNGIESEEITLNILEREIVDTIPANIAINGKQIVTVGDTTSLKATVYNKTSSPIMNAKVIWVSLDTAKATINTKGLLMAKKRGQVSIRASSVAAPTIQSLFEIIITSDSTNNRVDTVATFVSITGAKNTIEIGETLALSATALNSTQQIIANKSITWYSENPSIASVSSTGLVTGKTSGMVVIHAKASNYIANYTLAVLEQNRVPALDTIPVSITINGRQLIGGGDTISLKATVYNRTSSTIMNAKVIWVSLDTAKATINTKGLLMAKKRGQVSIRASSVTHPTIQSLFEIIITSDIIPNRIDTVATFVSITGAKNTIEIGETLSLSATALNSTQQIIANKPITWYSENQSIASVSSTGLVTGKTSGMVVIHAKASNYIANYTLAVNAMPQSSVARVELSASKNFLTPQQTLSISAKVYNTAQTLLTDKTVTWQSSDNNIVSISSNGIVTAVSMGTANITGTVDGIYSNNFKVNVISKLTRTASMNPVGHYAMGDISITQMNNDSLLITFHNNLNIDPALSIELHLSNSQTNISSAKLVSSLSNGRNVGPRTFTISNTLVDTYNYAVIWCRPANVRTGYSTMFQ